MTMHHDIDKLFKRGLSDYSEKPPSFVWGNIEQSLNKSRVRRRRNILYSVAASVAIVLSFGAGYLLTDSTYDNLIVENNVNAPIETAETDDNRVYNKAADKDIKPEVKKKSRATNIKENKVNKDVKNGIEQESDKPKVKKATKKTHGVKKVSSSGKLLPPMFASSSELVADNQQYEKQNEPLNKIEPIEAKLIAENSSNSSIEFVQKENEIKFSDYQTLSATNYSFNDKPVSKINLWSVGMSATPLMSFRDVSNVPSESVNNTDIYTNYEQEYQNEKPLTSYSVGVNVGYKVSKRWKIQSGLYMSELGQISENVILNEQPAYALYDNSSYNINTSTGNINIQGSPNQLIDRFAEPKEPDNSPFPKPARPGYVSERDLQADFVQTFEYVEVPVVVNYTIIDRKLSMNVSGGLSTNFLYNNNAYIVDEGARYDLDAESQDLKSMNYSGILGVGLEYPIITKLKINLQPTFRYSISPINDSGTAYPYSFGVYTGVNYSF